MSRIAGFMLDLKRPEGRKLLSSRSRRGINVNKKINQPLLEFRELSEFTRA